MSTAMIRPSPAALAPTPAAPGARAIGWTRRLLDALLTWQERAAQRRQLQSLGDPMLRDLGLSRADVAGEVAKPFWRP